MVVVVIPPGAGTRIRAAEIRGRLIRNYLEAVGGRVALQYVMSDQRMQVA